MKILVTGGGGFLGAWVIQRLLKRNVAVRVLDSNPDRSVVASIVGAAADAVEWVVGDVSDAVCVGQSMRGCDGVVHLAGLLTPACQDDPVRGAMVNLVGTLHVFEAAKTHGIAQVVYTSSVSVFGQDDGVTPCPSTHYGAFKLATEGCARTYWAYDRIASIGIRPGVVYGPGREQGLTAGPTLACKAAVRGEPYTIGYTGETCLVYVDDVAAAYEAAVLAPLAGAQVLNLSGSPVSTAAVITEIARHCPAAAITATGDRVPFTAHISDRQAYETFPQLTRTSLEDGIKRTLDYYRECEAQSHPSPAI